MIVFDNETDIDITHKLNNFELKTWLEHLTFIQKEIYALKKLFTLDLDDDVDGNDFLKKLDLIQKKNLQLFDELLNYKVSKPNDKLCENYQCDLDLISEHEINRNNYLNYLKQYRNLKNQIHKAIYGEKNDYNQEDIRYK
ncbi:MAG: hypothetical protein KDB74_13470 [Flavobacteriales bacterium]|nr:hypothetical protein [Flavobacteriales bacterium]